MNKTLKVSVTYGSVVGKARNYPYFQPALYKLHICQDGKIVWRHVAHLGIARRSRKLALQDAIKEGEKYKCPAGDWGSLHNKVVDRSLQGRTY